MIKQLTAGCSVIIRCFNEENHIGLLLNGLEEQTIKDVEIIIVDSGSTDGTLAIAGRFPVKVIKIEPEEFSFGRALNKGCEAATGDFIVIASAHVYPVYDTWFEHLIAPLNEPGTALVYGRQIGHKASEFSEHQIFAHWYPEKSVSQQGHPFCNNANAAIKRDVWQKLKYNEELTGLEDLDWAKRAIDAGYNICYAGDAKVIHVHNESRRQIRNRYRREALAIKQIMPGQHFTLIDFVKLFFANTFSDYYYAKKEKVLAKNLFDIPLFRLMQFWGTYRGHSQHGPVRQKLRERFYYPRKSVQKQTGCKKATVGNEIIYDGNTVKKEKFEQNN